MRVYATPIIEVTAHLEAVEGWPLLAYVQDGEDKGFTIAVDIIEIQFTPMRPEKVRMAMLTARARGPRVDLTEAGPVYGSGVHWLDLDINLIPEPVQKTVQEMERRAEKEWRELCSC